MLSFPYVRGSILALLSALLASGAGAQEVKTPRSPLRIPTAAVPAAIGGPIALETPASLAPQPLTGAPVAGAPLAAQPLAPLVSAVATQQAPAAIAPPGPSAADVARPAAAAARPGTAAAARPGAAAPSALKSLQTTGRALERKPGAAGAALDDLFGETPRSPAGAAPTPLAAETPPSAAVPGLDLTGMDPSVRPQDDFFHYAGGRWLAKTPIPADKASYGAFDALADTSQIAVREIVESAAKAGDAGGQAEKIGDLYKSFMNKRRIEKLGLSPVAPELARIDRLRSKSRLPALLAGALKDGVGAPVSLYVGQDDKEPTRYAVALFQSGLGMPDREYYLSDDPAMQKVQAKYLEYVTNLFTLAGEKEPARKAAAVYALEKALAARQWTKADSRDAEKTYNKVEVAELAALAPGFDWAGFLRRAGVPASETSVIVAQPSYLTGFAKVMNEQPLESWRLYLKKNVLSGAAPYLPDAFVKAQFAYSQALTGQPKMRARWKRGVNLVNGALGEAVGQAYVAKHFPASSKRRMQQLVENLRQAYRKRIEGLAWMSPETKERAYQKLDTFMPKIGYPDKWRDYSALEIRPGDLLGNIRRSNRFDYARSIGKLGKPIDRAEWGMTPQTVNAYYNPGLNEIVFPAAILQPPFFNPAADDAVNYGAIGAVIGHEMSHGFDDQGSKYDSEGRLNDWWTKQDRERFEARTARLAAQYSAYEPLPGLHLNGRNTLGENIADLGGVAAAYEAYRLSLGGKEAPVIGGLTGDQRFFLGYAQVWREVMRTEALRQQVATDPHSPPEYRVNGILRNTPEFYKTFGVKPGDKLYLDDEDRVSLW